MTVLLACSGIHGTVHTDHGDEDVGEPTTLVIEGATMTLTWSFAAVPWPSGVIESFTLLIDGAAEPWHRPLEQPAAYDQHSVLSLEQKVFIA